MTKALILEPHKPSHNLAWSNELKKDQVIFERPLKPVLRVDPKLYAQWVADLDSGIFATREAATAKLREAGESAWPALEKSLASSPTLEARIRITQLLGTQEDVLLPSPGRLRGIRSVELLGRLNGPGVRELIESLANGAPEAWLTGQAQRMLQRIKPSLTDGGS